MEASDGIKELRESLRVEGAFERGAFLSESTENKQGKMREEEGCYMRFYKEWGECKARFTGSKRLVC